MLSTAVDSYLAARRAAGYRLRDHEGILRDFARFACAKAEDWVRIQRRRCRRSTSLWTRVHALR